MILKPVEYLYHLVTDVKNFFYDKDWIVKQQLKVPVVSVGNLSFGGTGKTPFIQFLAGCLTNKKIVIVSRSYKASTQGPQKVDISTSNAASLFGDEAVLLQKTLPQCAVWSGPDKTETALASLADKPDLILIDDGFSHRRLIRNFDIVLIDSTRLQNEYHRESFNSLKRANAIVFTKAQSSVQEPKAKLIEKIRQKFPHLAASIYESETFTRVDLAIEDPLFVFCGIANPESFRKGLLDQNRQILEFKAFADHQDYTEKEQRHLLQSYLDLLVSNPNLKMITTEKDFTKITFLPLREKLNVVHYKLQLNPQQTQDLLEKIRASFKS